MSDSIFDEGSVARESASQSVGFILRQAREARGESVGDIAFALKLNPKQIEALEQERFEQLPGRAFVRGFLRNYARHVGVDPETLVASLTSPTQTVDLNVPMNAGGTLPSGGGVARKSSRGLGAVIVGMALMLTAGWYFDWFNVSDVPVAARERGSGLMGSTDNEVRPPGAEVLSSGSGAALPGEASVTGALPALQFAQVEADASGTDAAGSLPAASQDTSAAPQASPSGSDSNGTAVEQPGSARGETAATAVAADATSVQTSTPPPQTVAEQTPGAASAAVESDRGAASEGASSTAGDPSSQPGRGELVFRLRGESWIQVRDASGTTLYMGTGAAGTTRTVKGTPPFAVTVGNATEVSLEHGGEAVDMLPFIRTGVARLTVE